jgi:alkaline phosphatase D
MAKTFSRRAIVQRAWQAAAALALSRGSALAAAPTPVFLNDPFQLGVASGDPVADGFVIWTRLAPDPFDPEALPFEPIEVTWEVAADEGMKKIVARGHQMARPHMSHSVHVDVRGLEPARPYFYRFRCGPAVSRIGRAMTLPTPRLPVDRLKFAFASCSHLEQGYFTAYRDMAAQDLAFMIHLGDYIYESSWGTTVRHHPGPDPITLEDYRLFHAAYKLDPDLQTAHAVCPWFFTWDDHEVANDYSKDRAELTPDPKEFYQRKVAAYRAYYEHMPIRPYAQFANGEARIYQRAWYGDLMELNIPDLRQYRDPIACTTPERQGGRVVDVAACPELASPTRTMMGREQEFWLRNGFGRSGCKWNVIAQSLMFTDFDQILGPQIGIFTDSWGGYPAGRRQILDLIKTRGVQNVVSLGGDIHSFFVSKVMDNPKDMNSAVLMTEFVGTSITSESYNAALFNSLLPENPHISFCDDTVRGYVLCDVNHNTWRSDLRVVDNVRIRNGSVSTLKSYIVESGKAGPVPA